MKSSTAVFISTLLSSIPLFSEVASQEKDYQKAYCELRSNANPSYILGNITFTQFLDNAVLVYGRFYGMPPGPHGLNIVATGTLLDSFFENKIPNPCRELAYGDHYDPFGTDHGGRYDSKKYRHVGDLGNIFAERDGRGVISFTDRVIVPLNRLYHFILAVDEKASDLGKGKGRASKINGGNDRTIACCQIKPE